MAKSTYGTQLMVYDGTQWKKLIDIKDFPDLGGAPEQIQTTTLSDKAHTYINGIQSMSALTFTANMDFGEVGKEGSYLYIKDKYEKGNAIHHFAIAFYDDLDAASPSPIFVASWDGQLTIWVTGGGVNEVVGCTISISASTVIKSAKTLPTITA